jgi:hypothetical protein
MLSTSNHVLVQRVQLLQLQVSLNCQQSCHLQRQQHGHMCWHGLVSVQIPSVHGKAAGQLPNPITRSRWSYHCRTHNQPPRQEESGRPSSRTLLASSTVFEVEGHRALASR